MQYMPYVLEANKSMHAFVQSDQKNYTIIYKARTFNWRCKQLFTNETKHWILCMRNHEQNIIDTVVYDLETVEGW